MKKHALVWASGAKPDKIICKETLNHRGLIEMVSGLDVYKSTEKAYRRAYEALGIDIINRVPIDNAPVPTPDGETGSHPTRPYYYSSLGVYDTVMRHTYPCKNPEDIWNLDMDTIHYNDLMTPVPHPCRADDIMVRQQIIGDAGLYYPMLYTTLFMWGVEVLGFENFMLAACTEPKRFHDHFLIPCVNKSKAIIREMIKASDSPFLFVHDDLASGTGPFFHPSWYDDYIFPHYPGIFMEAKQMGKKVIFVADGNMSELLPKLIEIGVDGLMFENPATPIEKVIEHFGQPGKFMIGGINTVKLTTGSPNDIRKMVLDLMKKTDGLQGFAMASCGGLHGDIPLDNLIAYFDTRVEIGATPKDWRTRY